MSETITTSSRVATPIPLGRARWTRGFWADRFATCRDATVPSMGKLMTAISKQERDVQRRLFESLEEIDRF